MIQEKMRFRGVRPRHRFDAIAALIAAGAAACFAWLAWSVTHGSLTAFDAMARSHIHALTSPALTVVMKTATFMGSVGVIVAVTLGSVWFLFRRGRRRAAGLIAVAMLGALILDAVLKVQFHRQRPAPFFENVLPDSFSFPSGHALFSLCACGLIAMLTGPHQRWLLYVAAAFSLTIGVSRIYLGVHYPTDVIAGYLVGIGWLATLRAIYGPIDSST